MKYDLHIHSKYSSDGIIEPEKIVKIAAKRGLNGIAITDLLHDKKMKKHVLSFEILSITQKPPQNPLSSYYPSLQSLQPNP